MASYSVNLDGYGPINVTKKRGMRSVRLRINPKGEVAVSAPWHVPKYIVENFIKERQSWIIKNTPQDEPTLSDGVIFGKNTRLRVSNGSTTRNKALVTSNTLHITLAQPYQKHNTEQSRYIEKKVLEAMQNEAENVLLPRLYMLAKQHSHTYNQAFVKRLSSRWGSCDSQKNIILNIYLIQLPQKLQDYVMLHELTHTKHLNHSAAFWEHMSTLMPDYKIVRKELKNHRPRIYVKTI